MASLSALSDTTCDDPALEETGDFYAGPNKWGTATPCLKKKKDVRNFSKIRF
jgi:hypothetical protein